MNFIGIFSENAIFENIKKILKDNNINNISLIHINEKCIENVKNIKFKIIIIDINIKNIEDKIFTIRKLCDNSKYTAINTDINKDIKDFNINSYIITYGLNSKATITISSITEDNILIYLQKNLHCQNGKVAEIGEKMVKFEENDEEKRPPIYEILIIYIIFLI